MVCCRMLKRPPVYNGPEIRGDLPMAEEQLSIILVTAPSPEVAHQLAHGIVAGRLAACVNVVPQVMSTYVWQGKLEQATEALMIIKTRRSRYADLEQHIRTHHPYDTPEIVEIPVGEVMQQYRQWVIEATAQG
jgi:periplasmic divalent cation tolerance protein